MPIPITPNRSSEILLQALNDRDQQEANAFKNELIKYQLMKAREADTLSQQEKSFRQGLDQPVSPAQITPQGVENMVNTQGASEGLQKFGVETDPRLLLDINRKPTEYLDPVQKAQKMADYYTSIGDHDKAAKAMTMVKSLQEQQKLQELRFTDDLYGQYGDAWKREAKKLAPPARWDDIDRTEKTPYYTKYTDKDGSIHLVDKEGKATIFDNKDRTTDIREYEYAVKGGFRGSFETWQFKMKKAGATMIDISMGAKTKLQENIIETQTQIDAFKQMGSLFKDEYLTYKTKAQAQVENVGDKLGIPTSQFIQDRQEWYQAAKAQFLAYRKWVTGVAGGEKEMAEIAKSYPDPDNNSPAQYRANLRQAEVTAQRLQRRYSTFLAQGIIPTKAQLASIPLSSVKIEEEKGKWTTPTEVDDYFKKHPITGK